MGLKENDELNVKLLILVGVSPDRYSYFYKEDHQMQPSRHMTLKTQLYGRCYDVKTLKRRRNNVVLTSRVG